MRAWSQGCSSFPSCLSFPSRPWLGSGCGGGEGGAFPCQAEEESLRDTAVPGPGARCWGRLLAQVVRLLPWSGYDPGNLAMILVPFSASLLGPCMALTEQFPSVLF